MPARLERIGGTMFVVYDQKTLDHMEKDQGIDLGVGVMVPVGTKLTDFQKDWMVRCRLAGHLSRYARGSCESDRHECR